MGLGRRLFERVATGAWKSMGCQKQQSPSVRDGGDFRRQERGDCGSTANGGATAAPLGTGLAPMWSPESTHRLPPRTPERDGFPAAGTVSVRPYSVLVFSQDRP